MCEKETEMHPEEFSKSVGFTFTDNSTVACDLCGQSIALEPAYFAEPSELSFTQEFMMRDHARMHDIAKRQEDDHKRLVELEKTVHSLCDAPDDRAPLLNVDELRREQEEFTPAEEDPHAELRTMLRRKLGG